MEQPAQPGAEVPAPGARNEPQFGATIADPPCPGASKGEPGNSLRDILRPTRDDVTPTHGSTFDRPNGATHARPANGPTQVEESRRGAVVPVAAGISLIDLLALSGRTGQSTQSTVESSRMERSAGASPLPDRGRSRAIQRATHCRASPQQATSPPPRGLQKCRGRAPRRDAPEACWA